MRIGVSFRHWAVVAAGAAVLLLPGAARAEQPLAAAIAQGKPVIDIRTRYELVDDDTFTRKAEAITVRARLGYETGYWNGFQLAFDFDKVWGLGGEHYNSSRNGKTVYPFVGDPDLVTLNRLQVTYAAPMDTKIVVGRQRLKLGNERFVGNVGWRQHEQTFNALTLVNTSLKDLTATYSYVLRANRIFGPDDPNPNAGANANRTSYFKSDSHFIDLLFVGVPTLKLEGYAYLLDLNQPGPNPVTAKNLSTATFGLRAEDKFNLTGDLAAQLAGEYAHQTDYAGNTRGFDLNYGNAEAGLEYREISAGAGYEVLGGNGTAGFSTPLATLHAFNGWADVFLNTPANGLTDLYFKAGYGLTGVWGLKGITASVVYHQFDTEETSVDLGHEWDAALEVAVDKNASFLLKYANYDGAGHNDGSAAISSETDKSIFWLQAAYKF